MSTVASELRGLDIGTSQPGRPLTNALWKGLAVFGVLVSDMSFLEHLEELRRRIIKSLIAVAVGMAISTAYTPAIIRFLKAPAAKYGIEVVGYGGWEIFSLYFDVAFAAGITLAAPFILFQVWRFIEPALYPREKRYALPFLVSTTLFFILGAAFGYFVATPYIIEMSRQLAVLMDVTWSWHLVDIDRKPINTPFSKGNALELFLSPELGWLRRQAWVYVSNETNFMQRSSRSLSTSPSTNSGSVDAAEPAAPNVST